MMGGLYWIAAACFLGGAVTALVTYRRTRNRAQLAVAALCAVGAVAFAWFAANP